MEDFSNTSKIPDSILKFELQDILKSQETRERYIDSLVERFKKNTAVSGHIIEFTKSTLIDTERCVTNFNLVKLPDSLSMDRMPFGKSSEVSLELKNSAKILILLWYLVTIQILENKPRFHVGRPNIIDRTNYKNLGFMQKVFGDKVSVFKMNESDKDYDPKRTWMWSISVVDYKDIQGKAQIRQLIHLELD